MIHFDHTFGQRIEADINDLVNQIRAPRTSDPEKEIPAVVADLVEAYQRLNAWEHRRQAWVPVP